MLRNLQLTHQNKILLISVVVFVLLYLILNAKNAAVPPAAEKKPLYADTLIPAGQVLVPLELANIATIASLINQYGIIDLYAGSENSTVLIASRIKILKAPLNPNQYAIMVSESLSEEIMKSKGPFWGVVQNPDVQNKNIQTEKSVATVKVKTHVNKTKSRAKKKTRKVEIEYYTGAESY